MRPMWEEGDDLQSSPRFQWFGIWLAYGIGVLGIALSGVSAFEDDLSGWAFGAAIAALAFLISVLRAARFGRTREQGPHAKTPHL